MPKRFRTLRGQLFTGLFVPLAVVALINVWFSYQNAHRTSYLVLDNTLAASANSIAEQVRVRDGRIDAEIPPAALGMFAAGFADVVYYRVADAGGALVRGYGDLPPAPRSNGLQAVFYDGRFRGRDLRLVTVRQPLPSTTVAGPAEVTVGVTLAATGAMVRALWVTSALQQAALVAVASLLAWLSIVRGIAPLLRMGREVALRRPNEFRPFDPGGVQGELAPLVHALNGYMERLSRQLAAQRRFIANAAHQLRTPLAVLRTQAQVALREDDQAIKDEAARGVVRTTRHMARLTNQLLVLSKMEGEGQAAAAVVDMVVLTRQVLEEFADRAVASDIDLAFESSVAHVFTRGNATMLREVVANLTDNALRYAENAPVEVHVAAAGDRVVLTVADRGPGIPAESRELVFERFYRMREREPSTGSGLGLAIVREIVTAAGGTVELGNNPAGRGLLVTVALPLVDEPVAGGAPPSDLGEHRRPPLEEATL
ncbi:MAG: sensor histidine kinase [Candidatus Eremiobacteraeota bacterium]|nr:sensor histidine kinase [Candidatus Eremiobacteraeota bacterium]